MYYWGECLLTTTYLINRMPSTILQHQNPFELLFGKPPLLDHIRTFGCLCYVATTKQSRDKLQSGSTSCNLMGYPHGKKGYKVMSFIDKTIYVSRNAVFYEDVFSLAQQQ